MTKNSTVHKCATCPTRHKTEWRDLSDSELAMVEQSINGRQYEPGEILFHQGDIGNGIYCVQKGLVGSRYIDPEGNSALLQLGSAGTTIGYRSFLTNQTHRSSAEVLSPSYICFIGNSSISTLLLSNPQIGERFLQHAMEDIEDTESRLARSLTGTLVNRFLHMILVLYQKHGYRDEDGEPIVEIPVKRSDIAEMIGSQPESISRAIRKIQKRGLLKFDGRKVMIKNMDAILEEVGATL